MLSPGEKLGPYEIVGLLGAGGMGEVYRARDTRLDRSVAVKVLPAHVADREDARKRFEREARAVAGLNHPHICALHDIGPGYMVLELVDGETLAAKLSRGSLGLDQALTYARQLADALDRAHRAGVSHRDIKPGNIMVTRDGVKVLDFGLAKSNAPSTPPSPVDAMTATLSADLSVAGVVMGTPQYMAPELFAGEEAGVRSDVWAFGAVLFEMLTGRKAFEGKTYADLAHSIASAAPGPVSPPWLDRIVRRCLQKDPEDRYQSMRDIVLDLREAPAEALRTPSSGSRKPWIAAAAFACVAMAAGVWAWRSSGPADAPFRRLSLDLGRDLAIADSTASPTPRAGAMAVLAPDESRVAFIAHRGERPNQLYTRRLDQSATVALEQTQNSAGPFFSADSKWIGFFSDGKLKKISVEGGSPVELCAAPSPIGASWGNGFIAVALSFFGPLMKVPEGGGAPQPLTKLAKGESSHRWPFVIPGTNTLLYAAGMPTGFSQASVVAEKMDTGERRVVAAQATYPRFAQGYLFFYRNGTMFAVRFDPASLETQGDPMPVLEDVKGARDSGGAQFDITPSGAVLHRVMPVLRPEVRIGWMDRNGDFETLLSQNLTVLHVSLSPDGKRFAYRLAEADRSSIWAKDLAGGQPRRLSFEAGRHGPPIWTPDSTRVVYGTPNGVQWVRADGGGKPVRLLERGEPVWWTPDGKTLGVASQPMDPERRPCEMVSVEGDPERPRVGVRKPCFENPNALQPAWASTLSPDGRWMAYAAGYTAAEQVFVSAFPSGGGPWQISNKGGVMAQWSGDGKSVFFVAADDLLYSARVEGRGAALAAEAPQAWSTKARRISFGLGFTFSPNFDGSKILTYSDPDGDDMQDARVELHLNFGSEVKRRLGGGAK